MWLSANQPRQQALSPHSLPPPHCLCPVSPVASTCANNKENILRLTPALPFKEALSNNHFGSEENTLYGKVTANEL